MISVFEGCSSLKYIGLNHINAQSLTSMDGMFEGCSSLKNIDLSTFKVK